MRGRLVGLKKQYQYRGEIKWRFFAPKNADNDNPMKAWTPQTKNEFRAKVFKIITDTPSCSIISCISEAPTSFKHVSTVKSQDDLYFHTYKPITERFQYYLQDTSKITGREVLGLIVADHRGQGDDARMRELHERLVREERQYTSSYKNFVESLFFAPSHMSIGIQLVDMVAGAIWRAQTYDDRTWFDAIRSRIRGADRGTVDGYGIARFPKARWQGSVLS